MHLALFIIIALLIIGLFGALFWGISLLKKQQQIANNFIVTSTENEHLKEEVFSLKNTLDSVNNELKNEKTKGLNLEKTLSTYEEKIRSLQKDIEEKNTTLTNANNEHKTMLKENLKNLEEKYHLSLKTLEQKLQEHYVSQNQAILNQNKLMLNEDSKKILDEIFVPIKKSIDEYSKNLSDNEIKLKTNIDNMFKYSQQIKQDADQFARILKGDKKIRGDFGELQLKSVLESSGLLEGEHYFLQEDFTHNDDNHTRAKHYRPDAIVRLDKNRSIVIDAKFSLPNMDFSEFGDNEISEVGKIELAKNLKSRIDELAKKPYSAQEDKYDYVLLFIPYQNILDLVLSVDSGIYKYAEDKKIYLATPHTLFMALKTISITWRHIQSDQNIQSAFEEISKAYDKFAGVLEDFDSVKKNIRTLQGNVENMDKKLISGTGNMAGRFEKLKELGIKTNKAISTKYKQDQSLDYIEQQDNTQDKQ